MRVADMVKDTSDITFINIHRMVGLLVHNLAITHALKGLVQYRLRHLCQVVHTHGHVIVVVLGTACSFAVADVWTEAGIGRLEAVVGRTLILMAT